MAWLTNAPSPDPFLQADSVSASRGGVLDAVAGEAFDTGPTPLVSRWVTSGVLSGSRYGQRDMTADEANRYYAIPGVLEFDESVSEYRAQELYQIRRTEMRRADILARGERGLIGELGVGFAVSMTDPLNIAASFVPGGAPARLSRAGMSMNYGRHASRILQGAGYGMVGAAAIEGVVYPLAAIREQRDYAYGDSLLNILFGGGMGALGGGVGALLDVRAARLRAQEMAPTPGVAGMPAHVRQAVMTAAVVEVAEGRPVTAGRVSEKYEASPAEAGSEVRGALTDAELEAQVRTQAEALDAAPIIAAPLEAAAQQFDQMAAKSGGALADEMQALAEQMRADARARAAAGERADDGANYVRRATFRAGREGDAPARVSEDGVRGAVADVRDQVRRAGDQRALRSVLQLAGNGLKKPELVQLARALGADVRASDSKAAILDAIGARAREDLALRSRADEGEGADLLADDPGRPQAAPVARPQSAGTGGDNPYIRRRAFRTGHRDPSVDAVSRMLDSREGEPGGEGAGRDVPDIEPRDLGDDARAALAALEEENRQLARLTGETVDEAGGDVDPETMSELYRAAAFCIRHNGDAA